MSEDTTTKEDLGEPSVINAATAPVLVVLFTNSAPASACITLGDKTATIGRSDKCTLVLDESMLSREHARVSFENGSIRVLDAGSRNGTFLNGERIDGAATVKDSAVLRVGRTLVLLDVHGARFARGGVIADGGRVSGPEMRLLQARIEHVAQLGETMLVQGESGTGKEHAARSFHAASAYARGPFVAINCASLDRNIADRELFGSKRGAFSGATDTPGHFVAARGGTLFLDEIGEMDPAVQAKLLRAIETKTIQPLGSSSAREVDVLLCAGSNVQLARAVQEQRFRGDLYMRLARNEISLPPLRRRIEEIPFLLHEGVQQALGRDMQPLPMTTGVVERALLYSWAGQNVRAVFNQMKKALMRAHETASPEIMLEHFEVPQPDAPRSVATQQPLAGRAPPVRGATPPRDQAAVAERVIATYQATGSAPRAAEAAGVSRQHVYRVLRKHGIDVQRAAGGGDDDE